MYRNFIHIFTHIYSYSIPNYTIYISITRDFSLNIIPNVSKLLTNKIEPIINTYDIIE